MRDRLDIGQPGQKQWEEFRSSFAHALLMVFLIQDLPELAKDYPDSLRSRFDEGELRAEALRDEDPAYDGAYPVRGPDESIRSLEFIDAEEARFLMNQLFPPGETSEDFLWRSRGLSVVGLHASLEVYCKSLGMDQPRTPLPKWVEGALGPASLAAGTYSHLVELDETRHLFVHHRGVVSDRYVKNVGYTQLVTGERKALSDRDVRMFAETVWQVASHLRDSQSL